MNCEQNRARVKEKEEHKFIFIQEGEYKVLCLKTGGEFNTNNWRSGKIEQNKCPCCNEVIK